VFLEKSARTIVEVGMHEYGDLTAPAASRPNPTNLIRAVNRMRQKLRPADQANLESEVR